MIFGRKHPSLCILLTCTFIFTFTFLPYKHWTVGTKPLDLFSSLRIYFDQHSPTSNASELHTSISDGFNDTHLWSMRLADDNYFRLARLIPCRTVEYSVGSPPVKFDSCDRSTQNEFSIPNLVHAQKWIYQHQHPTNCSNKRFAIIQNYASSGFGSTVHQIAWAFALALADGRIAVYRSPGNWVRSKQKFFFFDTIIDIL